MRRLALALTGPLLAACTATDLAETASTLEVGGLYGDGSFDGVRPGSASDRDVDLAAVTVGFRPLAWLAPPTEIRLVDDPRAVLLAANARLEQGDDHDHPEDDEHEEAIANLQAEVSRLRTERDEERAAREEAESGGWVAWVQSGGLYLVLSALGVLLAYLKGVRVSGPGPAQEEPAAPPAE